MSYIILVKIQINFRGCLFGSQEVAGLSLRMLSALCEAYMNCNQFTENTLRNLFQLRDFVYLLRYLRVKWFVDEQFAPNPHGLLRGLQRNFNGLHPDDFQQ